MNQIKAFTIIMYILFLLTPLIHAQVPGQINYQGSLTDSLGNPVSDGNYDMEFALYDTDSVETALWSEQQSVWVADGIYNVVLGQPTNELTADLFSTPLYLGVKVGTDEEMIPRQMLTSVPFAFQAGSTSAGAVTSVMLAVDAVTTDKVAPDAITGDKIAGGAGSGVDADTVDGMDAASFSQSVHNHDARYYSREHVDSLEARIASLEEKLQHLTVIAGAVNGMTGPNVMITGANLHVRNGLGQTNSSNQTGNLIVGYNELRGTGNDRSGSHNIIVGQRHNYASYGGLVAGLNNSISGIYSTVSGGSYNMASGSISSIGGGEFNKANGVESSVSGGRHNTARGNYSFVGGGGGQNDYEGNIAFANYSSILGGRANGTGDVSLSWNSSGQYNELVPGTDHNIGIQSVVTSGYANIANGNYSSAIGGYSNDASGHYSSISGGSNNKASVSFASISGGTSNEASGLYSSVSGGYYNKATDYSSSISGGAENSADLTAASVSGGRNNKASGEYSFVGGGGGPDLSSGNEAFSNYSSILGGTQNIAGENSSSSHALGEFATVSGGFQNYASGESSSVNGGSGNEASGYYSSVSGGDSNEAFSWYSSILGGYQNVSGDNADPYNHFIGQHATVSGGTDNFARGEYSSVSGGSVNIATGNESSITGGRGNRAEGLRAAVHGGYGNHAWAWYSTVIGGQGNYAGNPADATHEQGRNSTVAGGYENDAYGNHSSVLGGAYNPANEEYSTNIGDAGRIYSNGDPVSW